MHVVRGGKLRALVAGSLVFMGSISAAVIGDASPASAASVVQTIHVGANETADDVSSDGTHVWVTNTNDFDLSGTVAEFDASTGALVRTIPVGPNPGSVSSDGTHVWVSSTPIFSPYNGTVFELDASTGALVRTIPVGTRPGGVSSDGTHVWVANTNDNTVSEISAFSGGVIQTIPVGYVPGAVSSDGTHVWVANFGFSTVTEIDAFYGSVVATIPVGFGPGGVSSDGTHVWVTGYASNTVTEIDASSGSVIATIGVGFQPLGVSSDGTHVWVADFCRAHVSCEHTVTELDAVGGGVIDSVYVGTSPNSVSSDGTHVWVTNPSDQTISEIGGLNVSNFAITFPRLAVATRGVSYGPVTLLAGNVGTSTSPYTTKLKWKKITIPKGMKLSSAGVLSGIPSAKLAVGQSSITVSVTETVVTLKGNTKVKSNTTAVATIPLTIT